MPPLWNDNVIRQSIRRAAAGRRNAAPLPSSATRKDSRFLRGALGAGAVIRRSWIFILLTALAFATRFWHLAHPPEVVFDEVHFGKFINGYFTGRYFFDIHPPLGKLLIALSGKLWGYAPGFPFTAIGDAYGDTQYVALRFAPALFGALLVPLAYLIIRRLGASRFAAGLGGAMILFDTAILTESRFILLDGILLFFVALAFYMNLRSLDAQPFSLSWWAWLAATGIVMGLAASVKWTALGVVALIGIMHLRQLGCSFKSWKHALAGAASRFLLLCILPLIIYAIGFAVHLSLLPLSGPGDAFMSAQFQSTLIGSAVHAPGPPPTFLQKVRELNAEMYKANAGIKADHPWKSPWWSWPLMLRSVSYWLKTFPEGKQARIVLIGNPFVWWGALVGIFAFLSSAFLSLRRHSRPILSERARILHQRGFALFLGLLFSWLPFMAVKRVLFLYHYLPALFFAILISALAFDAWTAENKLRLAFSVLCLLLAISFLFFSPLAYGTQLSGAAYQARLWLPSWQ